MPAQPYASLAEAILRRIAPVQNVGKTFRYHRRIAEADKFKTLCTDKTQGTIAFWYVTRSGWEEEQLTQSENVRISNYILTGFRLLKDDDESELTFQQVVDNVATAFRPQDNLDNLAELIEPVQASAISHDEPFGYLCHRAELTLRVQERFTP